MDILRSAYEAKIGRDPEAGWNLLPLMAQLVREAARFVPALQVRRLGCESSIARLLGKSDWTALEVPPSGISSLLYFDSSRYSFTCRCGSVVNFFEQKRVTSLPRVLKSDQ